MSELQFQIMALDIIIAIQLVTLAGFVLLAWKTLNRKGL